MFQVLKINPQFPMYIDRFLHTSNDMKNVFFKIQPKTFYDNTVT